MRYHNKKIVAYFIIFFMLVGLFSNTTNTITVDAATKSIGVQISNKKLSIIKGQTKQLYITGTSTAVKWSSSNKKIATVNKNGKVTAKKAGKTTINAKINNKVLKCTITVISIGLNYENLAIAKGSTKKLKLLNSTAKVKYSSSNNNICTVSKNGEVKGKKAGRATITAVVGKTKYKCNVVVKNNKVKKKDKSGTYNYIYNPEVKRTELSNEKSYTVNHNSNEIQVNINKDKNTLDIKSGDIIVLPKTSKNDSFVMKVKSINTTGSSLTYTGVEADYTEVFEDIDINSQQNFDFSNFDFANDIHTSEKPTSSNVMVNSVDISDDNDNNISAKITSNGMEIELNSNNNFLGSVTISNPILKSDIDIEINNYIPKVNKIMLSATETCKTKVGYKGAIKKNIYLGHKTIPIKDGFVCDINFYLKLKASGEVSIESETVFTAGINFNNGKLNGINDSTLSFEKANVKASGSAMFNLQIGLRWGGFWDDKEHEAVLSVNILKIEFLLGPSIKLSTQYYDTFPLVCNDNTIWLALSINLNDEYGVGKFIKCYHKINLNINILDDNDENPCRFSWHVEDGEVVPSCSHSQEQEPEWIYQKIKKIEISNSQEIALPLKQSEQLYRAFKVQNLSGEWVIDQINDNSTLDFLFAKNGIAKEEILGVVIGWTYFEDGNFGDCDYFVSFESPNNYEGGWFGLDFSEDNYWGKVPAKWCCSCFNMSYEQKSLDDIYEQKVLLSQYVPKSDQKVNFATVVFSDYSFAVVPFIYSDNGLEFMR